MEKPKISIFLAYDRKIIDKLISVINKIIKSSPILDVDIHILNKGIGEEMKEKISSLGTFEYFFDNVSQYIGGDYDYYKFAIDVISNASKAIYIDVTTPHDFDINKLLTYDIGDFYVGAYHDITFDGEPFARYTEKVLGISHYLYSSDDILVFNLQKSHGKGAYDRFMLYNGFTTFLVEPAEALFNLAYKDHILLLGDIESGVSGAKCEIEINDINSFLNKWNREKRAKDRLTVVEKIESFEREGIFDKDVEDDVPGRMIMPDEIEYLKKTPMQKLKAKVAFRMAKKFFKKATKKKMVIIEDKVEGLENLRFLDTGAIITCNHFNAMDSFAMHWVYLKSKQKKRMLYRIIREGNYTSFPGFFGFLMRNFYTLPLSSNHKTMKKFLEAVDTLLRDGQFVLVYPEQSMWWNYRKPKPLKSGAFTLASKNNVPVLPIFITMKDSPVLGPDGYYIQEYKMHVSKPIFPDAEKNQRENAEMMLKENERVWKKIYENEYQMPLEYTTE